MRLTEQVHLQLEVVLRPGDTAVDATAGNGHDTLAMAKLVGSTGKVIAIDLQAAAIESTCSRLEEAGQLSQCELIEGDHAEVFNELLAKYRGGISAITFNLGYLPGSDKALTTSPEKTLRALDAAQALLKPGGILLVTAYRGHPGGRDEAKQVAQWMGTLSGNHWHTEVREPLTENKESFPPILWIVRFEA
ncbi:MAG: tRNA (mnm(5)s(2)U34)-methyltransferase [Opitutales bacterium]